MGNFRRYASTVAIFAVVLYVALIIGVFGQISLWTGRDVIPEHGTALVLGPAMVTVAALILLAALLLRALRIPAKHQSISIGGAILIGLICLAGYIVVGSIAFASAHGGLVAGTLFAGENLLSPFGLSVGLLAAIVAFLDMLVLSSHVGENGRPRWPWEHGGP